MSRVANEKRRIRNTYTGLIIERRTDRGKDWVARGRQMRAERDNPFPIPGDCSRSYAHLGRNNIPHVFWAAFRRCSTMPRAALPSSLRNDLDGILRRYYPDFVCSSAIWVEESFPRVAGQAPSIPISFGPSLAGMCLVFDVLATLEFDRLTADRSDGELSGQSGL